MKSLLAASALLAASFLTPANAVTINVGDVGASGTTTLQGFVDVGNTATSISGLTGTLFLKYDGANAAHTAWTFDYTIKNTSSGNTTASSIGSFGLNTTPDLTGASSTGLFNLALLNPSFPNVNGANIIEVCFSAGNNSSNANGNTLTEGQSTSGTFELDFASAQNSISLDGAYLRFQGINATSPNLNGQSGVGFNGNPQVTTFSSVPGPIVGAGLPGLISACMGLVFLARRRRQRLA